MKPIYVILIVIILLIIIYGIWYLIANSNKSQTGIVKTSPVSGTVSSGASGEKIYFYKM